MPVVITGASDDLIEVDGDIREEFTYKNDNEGDLLAFSDGTLLHVAFGRFGVWRITPLVQGSAKLTIVQQADYEGTDTATLDGDVRWVVHGIGHAKRKDA
ncbi:hypothetical protein AB0K35_27615 [Micromonospora sp. NPDC053740]|uniref:hypothetical protein n=1 Tax=Micromonospora sp. NPDC053740 TaxID=3155173 RepID=UPI003422D049